MVKYVWINIVIYCRPTKISENGKTLIPLQFHLEGRTRTVYGCGTNKVMARKAAAKLAMRCLDMSI